MFIGRAMSQAVSLRRLTTEARVPSQVSLYEICDGQSGIGTGFLRVRRVFLSAPFHQCCMFIFSYVHVALRERQLSVAWEPSKKLLSFGNVGTLHRKVFLFRL